MTLVVSVIIMLQPEPVRRQTRGMGYMIVGAVTGLAIGLLAFSASKNLTMLYSFMILAVIAGIFFGLLLYSRTPDGRPLAIGSQNFFRYLLRICKTPRRQDMKSGPLLRCNLREPGM